MYHALIPSLFDLFQPGCCTLDLVLKMVGKNLYQHKKQTNRQKNLNNSLVFPNQGNKS